MKAKLKSILIKKCPNGFAFLSKCYRRIICVPRRNIKCLGCMVRYSPSIMNTKKTIRYIEKTGCSVARFGDGELGMVIGEKSIGFQPYSAELARELKKVLTTRQENLLVCLPHVYVNFFQYNRHSKNFWKDWIFLNLKQIYVYISRKTVLGNSLITRPYIDYKSNRNAKIVYPMLKRIWCGRDVLIIEGEKTRLGVGNDLLSDANTIKRILAPAEGAFAVRQKIIDAVIQIYENELILLALGPTATVLASDLTKIGMRAIDVGHLDIEYEWFLRGATQKTAIPGKYVNEASNGAVVAEEDNVEYHNQVIAHIGC